MSFEVTEVDSANTLAGTNDSDGDTPPDEPTPGGGGNRPKFTVVK